MTQRPKLKLWEIVAVVSAGALAAGGAALMLEVMDDAEPVAASGPSQDKVYPVGAFDQLSTVGPQDVVVTVGGEYSVRARGSAEALSRLEAVVEDGRLTIQPRGRFRNGFDWSRLTSATFFVTVPRLENVALAGSGEVSIDRIESPKFEASVAGPGELSVGTLAVDEADLSLAGPGSLKVSGTARGTHVSIGGSGEIEAGGLTSTTASVNIGGSGDASLTVTDEARISIMGSGDVDITGSASCSVSRMGSGDVSCNGVEQ